MKADRDEADPRYRALMQLLRTADTVWDASRLFFARWDLSPSQFNVLNLLRLFPDGLSQTELSRQLIMHRSNVTGLVDRLAKRGLLERKDVAADRRAYRVVLTHAGVKLIKEVLPLYYKGAMRVLKDLPARRVSEMMSDLEQVARTARAEAR